MNTFWYCFNMLLFVLLTIKLYKCYKLQYWGKDENVPIVGVWMLFTASLLWGVFQFFNFTGWVTVFGYPALTEYKLVGGLLLDLLLTLIIYRIAK